jgi:hypothetical protein
VENDGAAAFAASGAWPGRDSFPFELNSQAFHCVIITVLTDSVLNWRCGESVTSEQLVV